MTNPILRALWALTLAGIMLAGSATVLAQDDTSADDLAAAFPDTLGGVPLEVDVADGPAWLARQDAATPEGALVRQRTEELVAAVGRSVEDLAVASALHQPSPGNHAAITAVRVEGASGADLVRPAIGLLLGDVARPALRLRSVAGRDVLRVSDADLPGSYPRTVYAFGDTVWVVEAEQPVLAEILGALPAPEPEPAEDPAPALLAGMPFELDGQARAQVSVASGWSGLLDVAPGAMFGPEHEEAAADLFLEAGTTLDDLSSAFGVWENVAETRVFVVAFRIAGVDADAMRRVLDTVVVPSIAAQSQDPRIERREVGGREVVVLDDAAVAGPERAVETYHFLVAGDTIWMVNVSNADDPALAEAIAKLPA